MANPRAAFKQIDVTRAAKGVVKAGLPVGRIEIDRDGKIVIMVQDAPPAIEGNDWD
jgi:hypothetical protein